MENHSKRLQELRDKLDGLLKRQDEFSKEIRELKEALSALNDSGQARPEVETKEIAAEFPGKPQGAARDTAPSAARPERPEPAVEAAPGPGGPVYPKRFYRSRSRKILGGVASGLAEYLGINTAVSRLIWIVLTLLYCLGPLVYILLWIITPISPLPYRVGSQTTPTPAEPVPERAPQAPEPAPAPRASDAKPPSAQAQARGGFNLEKYIGENLISKIGIVILIIGTGLGVKYSIDNDLLGPGVRVLLGYLVGAALFFVSWRLRAKYANFSAILLSGSMAILYFMTYAAYAFYGMLPQWAAFALMLLFTAATAFGALTYNKQVIAHIGMVGAYGLPFLLDDGSGKPAVFFTYIAIINGGLLFIAFRKYWKLLSLFSFGLTWLIFFSWYATGFDADQHQAVAWIFLCLFFLLFYITFLTYKFIRKDVFDAPDIVLLLSNAFIFYGIGLHLIQLASGGMAYLGLFTLLNALPHALAGFVFYRYKAADKHILRLFAGLSLLFLTLTIPVQLDGNWVTLLWAGEAALLFWIGRSKNAPFYEKLSYPLLAVSFLSLIHDWAETIQASLGYTESGVVTAFLNPGFLTSLLYMGALGYINYAYFKNPETGPKDHNQSLGPMLSWALPALLLVASYTGIAVEIASYWNQLAVAREVHWQDSRIMGGYADMHSFKTVWLLNFSFLYLALLGALNRFKIKSRTLGVANLLLNGLALFLFLSVGLYTLSELRESYLHQDAFQPDPVGPFHIGIRYVSFVLAGAMLVMSHKLKNSAFMELGARDAATAADSILAVTAGWVITSELLHWLDLSGVANTYKLWVSILWGAYAVTLIVLGIWKKKKHLRVAAIVLFAFTLLKLFLYDIAHLNTLSKTIVFFTLGILLLVISYLYNRYKNRISNEDQEQEPLP